MKITNKQSSQSRSVYLPDALISSILEYLPLSDYPNVSLVSKRFNQLTQESFVCYTRHSFSKFIDWTMEDQCESESLVSPLRAKNCLYKDATEPKQIITAHFQIKNEWENLFGAYLSIQQKEILMEEMFEYIRNPPAPFPRLKRDTMAFQTNTMFQNFLTEVYYRLNKKCSVKDQRYMLLSEIVEKMCTNTEEFFSKGEEENEEISLALVSAQPNNAAKLYKLVYLMAQNHCQMVRSFLASIQNPLVFLEQYTKLWRNFVLITIDLDETFTTLSDHINNLYTKEFGSSSDTDKFAIWKLLRKVWTDEVFSQISGCVLEIINSLFSELHQQKAQESFDDKRQEVIALIQEIYHSIADLSYDECSIFFWDCQSISLGTPKALIDSHIINNIQNIYNQAGILSKVNANTLTAIFEEDRKLIKELFGKELAHYITEIQTSFLEDSLKGVFNSAIVKIKTSVNIPESIESTYRPSLNINKITNYLNIEREVIEGVSERKLGEAILQSCPLFGSFLNVFMKHEEKLKKQKEKFVEKQTRLCLRGFNNNNDETSENPLDSLKNFEIPAFG